MNIVCTGGASFIGSHLVDRLLAEGHDVTILDDFSSGSMVNLAHARRNSRCWIAELDLRGTYPGYIASHLQNADLLFHLAADHGGRGYVETQQVACSNNFAIDNNVLQACILAEVPKIIFASSGCIYPLWMQRRLDHEIFLEESDGEPPYNPDGLYGMAKLAAELTLKEMYKEYGIQSVSCRFFTVFGPRAKENHAIMSFIARAFIRQDPFLFWGDGTAVRNWTYIDDIVNGLILAMDIPGCEVLNLGTTEYQTVKEAINRVITLAQELWYPDYSPMLVADTTKPVGPQRRVCNNSKYMQLGGKPNATFLDGLRQTMFWYANSHTADIVAKDLGRLLIARK